MAIVFKPNETAYHASPKNGKTFTLKELQEAVGGFIQLIVLPGGRHLYMDEDGRSKNKPINQTATDLARHAGIDFVVGDVILLDPDEVSEEDDSDEVEVEEVQRSITTHPFVSTPKGNRCSSCNHLRSDSIHTPPEGGW